jgi:hypothetical protein
MNASDVAQRNRFAPNAPELDSLELDELLSELEL